MIDQIQQIAERTEEVLRITKENFLSELERKNPQAIEYIVNEYGSLVKSVLIYNLGNHKDRWEECFNDCLMAIWNHPDRFEEKKSEFKNWLCAIAKYKAIDLVRREQRHAGEVSLEQENGVEIGVVDIGASESDEELEILLNCLSSEDRELFMRRYVEEQPMEQISAETGMERDLIYSRISRGKKKIRSLFKERGGEYR